MKTVLAFATVLALAACAAYSGDKGKFKRLADNDYLQKQMDILKLLHRIHQQSLIKDQVDIGNSYDIEENIDHYKYPHVVKKFMAYYRKGLLGEKEHFTTYKERYREQAILLFDLFYYANDYDTFYKTACWARTHLNLGLFAFTFSIAIFQREDTKDFVLPPASEIYPYFFVRQDIIHKAQKYWIKEYGANNVQQHHIPVNFTARNQEDLLTYFREDVSLNTFNLYYYFNYPTWLNSTAYGKTFDSRGEQFYYTKKQIYARYFLERLSNDLPDIPSFAYDKPFKTAYNPNLRYDNGDEMSIRPSNLYPTDFDSFYISDIKNYEQSVEDAIDIGFVVTQEFKVYSLYHDELGMDYIGRIIEGTYDSVNPNFYGSLFHYYRRMLGRITDPYQKHELAPSALEHHVTALRDPAFYQLFKRLVHIVEKYKNRLPPYTHELSFPGVKVENVNVDKLYTFFEPFDINLSQSLYLAKIEDASKADIYARQYRLNHKPFTYTIDVSSDKKQDVYVRVFLGPKYDQLGRERDINDARHYFVELDRFLYQVEAGLTKIERHSSDSSIISHERDGYKELYVKVKEALEGKSKYYIDKNDNYCGYPENLLIPKGKTGGQAFTFYVILTPYVKRDEHDFEPYDYKAFSYCGVGNGRKYPDDKPLGFPFDRKINSYDFHTSNMYLKDVIIFHTKFEDISTSSH